MGTLKIIHLSTVGSTLTAHSNHPARRTIKAVDLIEVSLVTFPANLRARVTGVKARFQAAPEDEAVKLKRWAMDDFEDVLHVIAYAP